MGVHLTGHLVCRTATEAELVTTHLPEHIALSRTESGCLAFSIAPTDDPFVWSVDEEFEDQSTFESHQKRAASSDWGRATAGIERRYTIRTVPENPDRQL
ncbi:putative quinol monooxygenase [Homoserinibacter sp. GY 40078]|uniref:putative quinol monooxygenase n=1 Tax=Homoserinibacter sp. GY 40078 TaxID=2603275 RepID=UPI0011CC2E31|nr:antibiotic biosynthesis monooxygenase [Homoserinibacter sp. GY 40078]TXK17667.1 antibiotic biosynthesis monooxygenase [Homoserinibacter sp. GY 40078]